MRRVGKGICLAVAVVLALAPQLGWAQSNVSTGQIFGVITDPDGGVLPGVTAEAANSATGFTRRAITGGNGLFRIDLLPSGTYDLRASLSGFKTEIKKGVKVTLGSSVKIDFSMQISAVEEEIVVTADAPVIEITNPSVASSVSDQAIANLPLNGRDFTDFIALTPASVAAGGQSARGGVNIGARAIQNSFNIDGSNSQSSFFGEERGGTRPPFTFSQAAIKEFQVIKSSYNLQFNATGGVINAITKSGTNELHGDVFGYYRDGSMVATDAEGNEADDFDQKQFGFAIGGPVIKDKLHFFVAYDGQRYETPFFIEFRDFPEGREAEWEALTGLSYTEETTGVLQTNDADVILAKLDWQLSDNHLLVVRDNYSDQEGENLTSPTHYHNVGRSSNGVESNSFNSFVVTLNSVLSADAFNELVVQYAAEERPRAPNSTIPEVAIYGYRANFGQTNFHPSGLDEDRFQFIDNFSYYLGSHTLRVGTNIDLVSFDNYFFRYQGGSYSYSNWDDFFNGDVYRYTQAFSEYDGRVKFDSNQYAFYAQDEWRATPNLTLTYGIRYDYQEHDDPQETNPLFPDTGNIPSDGDNIAPRFGFAWDIAGDGKQVLRGGLGYFYGNTPTLLIANALLNNGIRVITYRAYGDDAPTFPDRWNSISDLEGQTPSIFVVDPDFENPETLRMSLGYEREFAGDYSLGIDVIYSETRHLERKQDLNIGPDGGMTDDGRPTYEEGANYSDFDQIKQFKSDAEADYLAVILKGRKRYSNGWMFDASYTWSQARDEDSNERSVSSSGNYPEDQYNLHAEWGPSDFDVEHKFVASATYELPYDFLVSAIVFMRSGFPYSALDQRDNNNDGYDRNERAVVEVSPGVFYHYGRNTFNQPWVYNMDLRLSKTFSFGNSMGLELMAEVFNVFNNDNWRTTEDTLVNWAGEIDEDFGEKDRAGSPRQVQAGVKFSF